MSVKSASPAEVRAWGLAQNPPLAKDGNGKFSKALIDAYNKAHRTKYRPGQFRPQVLVTAKGATGRPLRGIVNVAEARAALVAAGIPVGERGRLRPEALAQGYLLVREASKAPASA